MTEGPWYERPLARTGAILALLAYLPALTAAPGRMPSDSKLYLYLDPARFLGDAASTFDPRQFAGWVPHQHVGYLWPSGPWFWVFETLGMPDWIAHRLWIGSLMLVAGLGVRWCARSLGVGPMAAFAAAITYQVSLYLLPYVSRTSVMLLPWAGLGWIVALTIRATRRRTWGDPAAIALVVLTVGAVNATALAMIVPGPALWLVHSAWQRLITWRDAVIVAVRVGVLSVAVSLWWIAMLLIQGRYGTDVLPYSESLGDVSLTSTSAETWRGLGYWLFYVRDPYAATTTESLRYLSSTPSIVVSYLVPLLAVAALAWARWAHRRFAALLVVTGLVLAVGVHPVGERSPLMRLLAGDDESGLALALRSSTRALPVTMLGVALAFAMAVEASSRSQMRPFRVPTHWVTGGVVAMVAVANLPALWTGGFVDPALERDQDPPPAWTDAASALDMSGADARVLQLPGAEFGAYRWGYTVDQPLPGLTEKPLVTRDLLPLGSPGAMDLLYALDDRVQQGVLEPEALTPVAQLLGVDTVWLTNDIAYDRFRTARPEVVRADVAAAPGVGELVPYGALFLNRPDVPVTDERAVGDPRVGQPVVPVELAVLDDPGRVIRAAAAELVVSGSGDGLVDAAAVGLVMPLSTVTRFSAHLDEIEGELLNAEGLVVTDSNRDRARHWRSSQDTTGYTEPGGAAQDVLRPSSSDARLDVFDTNDPSTQTIAMQRGLVTATATSYGEPFAYLPEHRPFMAVDGDPETAWLVGEHGDPIGEMIRVGYTGRIEELTLHQPDVPGARRITEVHIVESGPTASTEARAVVLDERSWGTTGQPVPMLLLAESGTIEITIVAVAGGTPFTGSAVAGVGFSEIDTGLGPSTEIVRPPHDALDELAAATPLALTFARLRSDPMDRWRDDPEPELIREFDISSSREFDVGLTVRVDARAPDSELASLFGWPVVATTRLTGSPRNAGVAAFDDDPSTAWITAFGAAEGAVLTTSAEQPITSVGVGQPVTGVSRATSMSIRSGAEEREVTLVPDAAGNAVVAVDPPLPPGEVSFTITGIDPEITIDRRFGDPVTLPTAITELTFDGRPIVPRLGATTTSIDCTPIVSVGGQLITATVEVVDDTWLDGAAVSVEPCVGSLALVEGTHSVVQDTERPISLDQLTLDDGVRQAQAGVAAPPTVEVLDQDRFTRTVQIDSCSAGCWLVVGEGYSDAWTAEGPAGSLGAPTRVDGGFNGWRIPPTDGPVVVEVAWTAQRGLTWALILTLLAAVTAVALLVIDRRSSNESVIEWAIATGPGPRWWPPAGRLPMRTGWTIAVLWPVLAALVVSPVWALWGAIGAVAVLITRRRRIPELTALASLLVVSVVVIVRERRVAPLPNGGWPSTFESVHGLGMFAIVCLLVGALTARDANITSGSGIDTESAGESVTDESTAVHA